MLSTPVRARRSDAEREREDDGDREDGAAEESANGVPHILPHALYGREAPRRRRDFLMHSLLELAFCQLLARRKEPGLIPRALLKLLVNWL